MSRPDGCCAALGAVSERAWRFASVRPLLARGQAAVAVVLRLGYRSGRLLRRVRVVVFVKSK